MYSTIGDSLFNSLNRSYIATFEFLPNIITGLVVILIGIILGSIVKRLILELFRVLRIEAYLKKYGVPEAKKDFTWANLMAEIVRWFIILVFLMTAADIWRLPQITALLNTFLLYLPNVFVAAIMAVVGLVFATLIYDVVIASTREISPKASRAIALSARWAIIIFVLLAVLNQLGVAQDLIRILFTGFVAMIALAGGIAFGLGGQDTAHLILESIRKRLK